MMRDFLVTWASDVVVVLATKLGQLEGLKYKLGSQQNLDSLPQKAQPLAHRQRREV
jgi:hypothetical protein